MDRGVFLLCDTYKRLLELSVQTTNYTEVYPSVLLNGEISCPNVKVPLLTHTAPDRVDSRRIPTGNPHEQCTKVYHHYSLLTEK